jgi:hypothetical protein
MLSSLYPDRFSDGYSSWPLRAVGYAHALREALGASLPRAAALPLSLAAIGFLGHASYRRGQAAGERELAPDLLRSVVYGTTLNSVITLWLECVTLPSLLTGVLRRAVPAPAGALARAGPAALAVALLPVATLPASCHVADALMEWAFRPAIEHFARARAPPGGGDAGGYVPPMPEDLLEGGAAGNEQLMSLLPPDFDALDRERFKWALDNDPRSVYPELAKQALAKPAAGAAGQKGEPPGGAPAAPERRLG